MSGDIDDIDDPRITAYMLGELDEAERAEIAPLLSTNAPAEKYAESVRAIAGTLRTALQIEQPPQLSAAQRQRISSAIWRKQTGLFRGQKKTKPASRALEVAVAFICLVILAGILIPVMTTVKSTSRVTSSKAAMRAVVMAVEAYREDFGRYPPDNIPTSNGSQVLYFYLCQRFTIGEMHYGPYLDVRANRIYTGNGHEGIRSSLGGEYAYKLLVGDDGKPKGYLIVDPGMDNLLGGSLDARKGFIPDGSDASIDNLYSDDRR